MQLSPVQSQPPAPTRRRPRWALLVIAALLGAVIGCADLGAQRLLSYPVAGLANSAAVWAVAAFAIGTCARGNRWLAAGTGVIALCVAVQSYYLAAVVVQHDSLDSLTSRTTQLWVGFAIVVGALFGAAGSWALDEYAPTRAIGMALVPSVLFAEALDLAGIGAHSTGATQWQLSSAGLEGVLGAIVAIGVVARYGRDRLDWLRVIGLCAPITAGGLFLYVASGYAA